MQALLSGAVKNAYGVCLTRKDLYKVRALDELSMLSSRLPLSFPPRGEMTKMERIIHVFKSNPSSKRAGNVGIWKRSLKL